MNNAAEVRPVVSNTQAFVNLINDGSEPWRQWSVDFHYANQINDRVHFSVGLAYTEMGKILALNAFNNTQEVLGLLGIEDVPENVTELRSNVTERFIGIPCYLRKYFHLGQSENWVMNIGVGAELAYYTTSTEEFTAVAPDESVTTIITFEDLSYNKVHLFTHFRAEVNRNIAGPLWLQFGAMGTFCPISNQLVDAHPFSVVAELRAKGRSKQRCSGVNLLVRSIVVRRLPLVICRKTRIV